MGDTQYNERCLYKEYRICSSTQKENNLKLFKTLGKDKNFSKKKLRKIKF